MSGGEGPVDDNGFRLTDEQVKRRRQRSLVIGLALAGLALLFYLVTLVKLGPGVVDRPL